MEPARNGGASLSARSQSPSIDLQSLVTILSKRLKENKIVSWSDQKSCMAIKIESTFVENLIKDLQDKKVSFVRDMSPPGNGATARVGGRIYGDRDKTWKALGNLRERITEQVRDAWPDSKPSMVYDNASNAFKHWAASRDDSQEVVGRIWEVEHATMQPVSFASPTKDALGRVITIVEIVEWRNTINDFIRNAAEVFCRDNDEEDLSDVESWLREQVNDPANFLMNRFFSFLHDEALSKMRLQVAVDIMKALAEAESTRSSPTGPLYIYTQNIINAVEFFRKEGFIVDVSASTGKTINLGEYVDKVYFYACLPVWPQWHVQLFESQANMGNGNPAIRREVSYRFRINGKNPEERARAFDVRLGKIQNAIIDFKEDKSDLGLERRLAELFFLCLVTPQNGATAPKDVAMAAQKLKERFESHRSKDAFVEDAGKIVHLLKERSSIMIDVGKSLVALLKKSSTKRIVGDAAKKNYTISVSSKIIDTDGILARQEKNIINHNQSKPHAVEWFKYLNIIDNQSNKQTFLGESVISYGVETEFKERILVKSSEKRKIYMKRLLDDPVLPVFFMLYDNTSKQTEPGKKAIELARRYFQKSPGVRVFIAEEGMIPQEKPGVPYLRGAVVTAISLVVYMALWEILRRVREVFPNVHPVFLRMQSRGADKELNGEGWKEELRNADTTLYAVTQAIEKTLARDGATTLQGIVLDESSNMKFRLNGALVAAASGQPLRFEFDGKIDKVALIAYATRPCDEHPNNRDNKCYLFSLRTYIAEREEPGYGVLRCAGMKSALVDSTEAFKEPAPLFEEIARLHKQGVRHVMLLSHHYGNRHIGRAAERHSPHSTREFLENVHTKFSDLQVYVMRRDVFSAFRIKGRQQNESAFEVLKYDEHMPMYKDLSSSRSILPVYTFATLAVVGQDPGNERPQSGFCTYFFDYVSGSHIAYERSRDYALGATDEGKRHKCSLVSVLRAVHFFESQKVPGNEGPHFPVLDPYEWASPVKRIAAGEIIANSFDNSIISLPATLTYASLELHKEGYAQ